MAAPTSGCGDNGHDAGDGTAHHESALRGGHPPHDATGRTRSRRASLATADRPPAASASVQPFFRSDWPSSPRRRAGTQAAAPRGRTGRRYGHAPLPGPPPSPAPRPPDHRNASGKRCYQPSLGPCSDTRPSASAVLGRGTRGQAGVVRQRGHGLAEGVGGDQVEAGGGGGSFQSAWGRTGAPATQRRGGSRHWHVTTARGRLDAGGDVERRNCVGSSGIRALRRRSAPCRVHVATPGQEERPAGPVPGTHGLSREP
jgi:hypothetical protein